MKNNKTEKLIKLKNLKLTNIRDTLKEIDGPLPGGQSSRHFKEDKILRTMGLIRNLKSHYFDHI